ncbi:MAG: CBS domain-containing protein [Candidatus Eremiobacteraeota bacterium]|nr:CBS domain-containing protein [Candidatus Eremiobacteraeota bacterium]MBC5801755.1 CBS domain-containing protein [Candidatus Eremiobacteraeota bacterium]MBC5820853.1 CBS domain-containing protein [Candidatus Eremiobacteraeota bacterium]
MLLTCSERERVFRERQNDTSRPLAAGKDPKSTRAGELGEGKPVTIGADDSLDEALQTMTDHKVRRLPVIDGHQLVGVLSQADLAKTMPPEKAGRLLAAISSDN